jgi:hypothetical protein
MEKYTFVLTPDEVSLVGQALGELPYKLSAGLITKLQRQANEQENAAKAPDPTE